MKVETTRFGVIEVRDDDGLITFPAGLVGFSRATRYVILDHPGGGPFQWLQSVEVPSLAFVIADPLIFFSDYRVPVTRADLGSIGIDRVEDGVVRVILVVPGDPYRITANLKGPIVINPRDRVAVQLVLDVPAYATKHYIFPEEARQGARNHARPLP